MHSYTNFSPILAKVSEVFPQKLTLSLRQLDDLDSGA